MDVKGVLKHNKRQDITKMTRSYYYLQKIPINEYQGL